MGVNRWRAVREAAPGVQGYLAHKKTLPPRTLPWAYAQGPTGVIRGRALSYGRLTPVGVGV